MPIEGFNKLNTLMKYEELSGIDPTTESPSKVLPQIQQQRKAQTSADKDVKEYDASSISSGMRKTS